MAQEHFGDWTALDVMAEPGSKAGGAIALVLSIGFAVAAIVTYAYAEGEWLSRMPTSGGIGVGSSAYSTVQFERPIVFAALSAAFAAISIAVRRPLLRGKLFWRPIYDAPPSQ